MSGHTYSASRTGDTARVLLWERPGKRHAEEIAETLRRKDVGETVASLEPSPGARLTRCDDWTITYRQSTPEEIAQSILKDHAIQSHWQRNGEQIAGLLAEAVKAARA